MAGACTWQGHTHRPPEVEGLGAMGILLSLSPLELHAAKRRDRRLAADQDRRPLRRAQCFGDAHVQSGGGGEVLTGNVILPRLTGAAAEAFAVSAHEEINRIACAVVS